MSLFFRYLCVFAFFCSWDVAAQQADLAVVKTGTTKASRGEQVSYNVLLTNEGPNDAISVTMVDQIPDGMTFVSATQNDGPAFNCPLPPVGSTGSINCTNVLFAAGASATFTFVFAIDENVALGTIFTNIATASSQTPDPDNSNNSSEAVTVMPAADLEVIKTGPATASAGSDVTYMIEVTNDGPDEAVSVVLDDDIPAGMTFVSATAPAGFSCTDPGVGLGGTVTCTATTLGIGASATFTFVFNIDGATPPGTIFSNVAEVASKEEDEPVMFDPNEENNSSVVVTVVPFPPQADLGVMKSGPGAAGPDTDVTYTISLTNGGPAAATNVSLTDTLPGTMTFVSLAQTGPALNCTTPAVGAGGTVTCTAASFPAGQTATLTLIAHIPADTPSGTEYSNQAVVNSDQDPNEENDVATAATIVSAVDISVVKSTAATAVNAGDTISYTINVANAGPDAALTVTLVDQLPPGTTFVSFIQNNGPFAECTRPQVGASGTVQCTFPMGIGGTAQFTLQILAGDTTSITNTAVVTTENFDVDNSDNSSSVTTPVTPQANLAVAKSGPATITAGTDVTYTVTLTNNGPSTASNVALTDDVPAGMTFVSATQNTGPTFICGGGATITCTIGTFAPSATATFTFVMHVAPSATGSIDNVATVAATTADPAGGNNTSTVSSTVTTSANLAVVKSGPASAVAGETVTYTITASNAGPSTAVNVTVSDILPPNTTFVSATPNCSEAAGTITCTIASFDPSATATFTFVFAVSPTATGSVVNTASITSPTPDPAPTNNSSTTTASLSSSADVSVTKSGPAAVAAGSNATYTVTVANAGPSTASNVTLTDTLPPNATFVSVEQTAGPTFNCTPPAVGTTGQLVCTIAALAPAAPATFTIVVNANAGASGTVDNTATVSSSTADPNAANNTATSSAGIDPGPTDLTITKTASGDRFGAGSAVTYTIAVTNNGPSVAFGTTVTDVLPAGTTLLSATPSQGTCTGTTTVVCTLGTLAPSSSATVILEVRLPLTMGSVSNTASVSAANLDTNGANNASTTALAVVSEIPSLSEYGLMLLAMMLAMIGMVTLRIR